MSMFGQAWQNQVSASAASVNRDKGANAVVVASPSGPPRFFMTLFCVNCSKEQWEGCGGGRQTTILFNAPYTKLYPEFMWWKKRECRPRKGFKNGFPGQ